MDIKYFPNILIVDDNEDNLLTLKSTLRNIHAQIVMAQSGKEAVLHTKQKDFAVIILDVQMPEMDGYEAATLIRQGSRNQHSPIIFLTAVYFDTTNLIKGYQTGAVDYITKPFNHEILISKVNIFLELDQAKNDLIKSKTNFENVVQDQTDMICRTDTSFYPNFINRAFLLAFSTTFEKIKAKPVLDAIIQRDRDKISRALMLLSPSNPIIKLKHSLTISNGRELKVRTVFRALYDNNLIHTGYQLVIQDITSEVQSLEELVLTKKTLEESCKSKALILANLNHDLRTPLNSIIGMSEVLLDSSLTNNQQDDARVIHKSANNLLTLLNVFADFTKTEAGEIKSTNYWFDLKTDLSSITLTSVPGQKDLGQKVFLNFTPNVPSKINSDPQGLGKILSYLAHILATLVNNENIKINTDSKNIDNNNILLEFVIESEMAVPDELSKNIIAFLEHGDPEISHKNGKLALELAVSKNLCKLMGGSISFEQNELQAAVFKFSLSAETEGTSSSNSVSILVVEDNLLNQKVVGTTLKKRGYSYNLAGDGRTALDKFKQTRFDFILMDIQMPVMDGYETTRQIRNFEKENPSGSSAKIYALTANATSEDQKKCLAVGMDGFFAKPFNFIELEKVILQIADSK